MSAPIVRTLHSDSATHQEARRGGVLRQVLREHPDFDPKIAARLYLAAHIRTPGATNAELRAEIVAGYARYFGGVQRNLDKREYDRQRRECAVLQNLETTDEPNLYRPDDQDRGQQLQDHRRAVRAAQGAEIVESWTEDVVQPHGGVSGLYALPGEHAEALAAGIETLAPGARETIERYLDGWTLAEIAQQTGRGEPAVRKQMSRIRTKLRANPRIAALRERAANHKDNTSTSSDREPPRGPATRAGSGDVGNTDAQEGRNQ